jgi:hypothetical protein
VRLTNSALKSSVKGPASAPIEDKKRGLFSRLFGKS